MAVISEIVTQDHRIKGTPFPVVGIPAPVQSEREHRIDVLNAEVKSLNQKLNNALNTIRNLEYAGEFNPLILAKELKDAVAVIGAPFTVEANVMTVEFLSTTQSKDLFGAFLNDMVENALEAGFSVRTKKFGPTTVKKVELGRK